MPKLTRNIIFFIIGLLILTVSLEYFRKGQLDVEQPLLFFAVIVVLGAFGGYMVTWVSQGKNQ